MATSRIVNVKTRLDSGAGGAFQVSDCATPPYKVDSHGVPNEKGEFTAVPILKRECMRTILNTDDAHPIVTADFGTIIRWWKEHSSSDGPGQQYAVTIERAWKSFGYTGPNGEQRLTIGQLPETDPYTKVDPALDHPTDITNIFGFLGKMFGNPLAVLAIMVGFPMIAFGIYKGLQ